MASSSALSRILRRRLAVQRLSSAPMPSAVDAIRLLVCVQAQDSTLARWSLGMRTRGSTDDSVLAEQCTGTFVRTHVLRPTWHYVAAEDLRWLLRLTSPKVESSMTARHRQLGLDEHALRRGMDALAGLLAGRALTRREIGSLAHPALPEAGPSLGHLLLVAELRGLICSGPPHGTEHTYALVDEVVPAGHDDDLDRDDAIRRLVLRFFSGHGPAADRDLARWCSLRLTEIRRAAASLVAAGELMEVRVDDEPLWHAPGPPPRARSAHAAYLLPAFDEAFLTYPRHAFPRRGQSPADRSRIFAQAGGGVVLVDGRDVGAFARRSTSPGYHLVVDLDDEITHREEALVEQASARLAQFAGREHRLHIRH